jgi:hypothetical protein
MTDSLFIRHLPDWSYAGKPADGAVYHAKRTEGPFEIRDMSSGRSYAENTLELMPYKVVNGYLIPHYTQEKSPSRNRREQELLRDRVQRFFYSAEPGIDAIRTAEEIKSEIDHFDKKLDTINTIRHEKGLTDFSLSIPYRDCSRKERELISQGANFVGHAVNRLGRLGQIILQGNRIGVNIEYDDAWIETHLDDIKTEFNELYKRLTDDKHKSLVRCVLTRDGRVDHDAVFHHLIRELVKPVLPYTRKGATEEQGNALESMTRNNIVTEIGNALEAIDEAFQITQSMTSHRVFRDFVRQADRAQQHESKPIVLSTKGMELSDYASLVNEYHDMCRARACIRSEDADNFNRVANRLRFLNAEIGLYHEALQEAAEAIYKTSPQMTAEMRDLARQRFEMASQTISLLKRGVAMMGEMAELRLPRNSKANGIYDEGKTHDLPDDARVHQRYRLNDKEKSDMSTVGRYRAKVWLLQQNMLRGQSAEI